jgi:hypothetical protein
MLGDESDTALDELRSLVAEESSAEATAATSLLSRRPNCEWNSA